MAKKPKNKPCPDCTGTRHHKCLTTAVIIGCTHEPYVDVNLWEAFCDFCKVVKPDALVRNGDIFDFYQISRFVHDPAREDLMAYERDVFLEHDAQLRKALPRNCEKIALKGNHEDRVAKFALYHPDIRVFMKNFGMVLPDWNCFLQLDKHGYDARDSNGVQLPRLSLGGLDVWHGKSFAKHAVMHNLIRMGNNYCCHSHRMSAWHRKVGGNVLHGYEGGYMADPRLAQDYIEDEEDWCQGFGVVHFDDTTKYFDVDLVVVKQDGLKKRFAYASDYWEWTI